jgi:diguanylate cyclase
VLSLFEGYYDLEYVNNRLRIGLVHKRIGVEPKLYLSAVKTLKDTINLALDEHIDDKAHLRLVIDALDKLLYFDTTLIFDTYIRGLLTEVESAKDKALTYAQGLEAKVAERTRQLQELSQHDSLTGLYNQRSLNDSLRRELMVAKRQKKSFSLVYFDIDDFKLINDKRGHFAGDEILRMVAEALRKTCREVDIPCRYGGDEFCLVLPDCALADAEAACQRLIAHFASHVADVTLSVGIAQTGPSDYLEPGELLRAADAKMYEAKTYPGFKICV